MYTSRGEGLSLYAPFSSLKNSHRFLLICQPAPETEEEMMVEVFKYTERVVNMVRPRKLLFMAIGVYPIRMTLWQVLTRNIDGVAPRAKMNQQRSRRFRTAKEAREVREKAERKGEKLPETKAFDSNCITPGAFPFEVVVRSRRASGPHKSRECGCAV